LQSYPDRVLQGAPEPVEPPDDEEIAFPDIVERLLQSRPVFARPAGGIGEDAVASRSNEGVLLQIEDLLEGGDAGIADGGSHGFIVSKISDECKRWDIDTETAFVTRL